MDAMHKGHRKRQKERFLKEGLQNFTDAQVLELLLFYALPQKDTKHLAYTLLQQFGGLAAVLQARPADLAAVDGIGENAAVLLHMIPQLLSRYLESGRAPGTILTTTTQCGEFLVPYFFGAREEQVYLLCLDAKCKVLGCHLVHRGGINTAAVPIRKVVELALSANATSVVLAHNHTSGLALPSDADKETTRRLHAALDAVDILLVDHVIVGGEDFVSLSEDGFFETLRK